MSERCEKEVFDGWEDSDRCLLDKHDDEIPHNFLSPSDDEVSQRRFRSNDAK